MLPPRSMAPLPPEPEPPDPPLPLPPLPLLPESTPPLPPPMPPDPPPLDPPVPPVLPHAIMTNTLEIPMTRFMHSSWSEPFVATHASSPLVMRNHAHCQLRWPVLVKKKLNAASTAPRERLQTPISRRGGPGSETCDCR